MCLIWISLRFGWGVVLLGGRREWHHNHSVPVPRLGGAALAATFVFVEACIAITRPELRAGMPGRDETPHSAGSLTADANGGGGRI